MGIGRFIRSERSTDRGIACQEANRGYASAVSDADGGQMDHKNNQDHDQDAEPTMNAPPGETPRDTGRSAEGRGSDDPGAPMNESEQEASEHPSAQPPDEGS